MKSSVVLFHGLVLMVFLASANAHWKNKDDIGKCRVPDEKKKDSWKWVDCIYNGGNPIMISTTKRPTTTQKPLKVDGYFKNRGPGKCLIKSDTQKTRKGNQPAWVWVDCDYTSGIPKPITTKPPVKTTMKPAVQPAASPRPQMPQQIPVRPPVPVPVPTQRPILTPYPSPIPTRRPQPPPTPVRPPMPAPCHVLPPQSPSIPVRPPVLAPYPSPIPPRPPQPPPAPVRPPTIVSVPVYPQPFPAPPSIPVRPPMPPPTRPPLPAPVRPPVPAPTSVRPPQQPSTTVKPPMPITSRPTTTSPAPTKYWKNTWTTTAPNLICNNRWCWDGKMWFDKGAGPTQKTVNIFKKPTLP